MSRSLVVSLAFGLAFVASPAWAQQPLQPAPAPTTQQPTVDPYAVQPVAQPAPPAMTAQPVPAQPMDPYAQYGEPDEEDDSMDVTYDISTSPDAGDQQYDDGYDANAYQQFESQLAPYGTWENDPDYGEVWEPSATEVGYDFEPYATGGHFMYSDYGWTWASDWGWGSVPFHYGRWAYRGGRGWCWIPGTTWGPGWVHWRWGGGYVGWAPMGPRGHVVGAPRGVRSPWRFTVANQLGSARPHFLPSRAVASVWRGTTAVNNVASVNVHGANVRFNAGPSSAMMVAATGRAVAPSPLRTAAPRALPNQAIAPRLGTPLMQRPWLSHPPTTYARTGSYELGSRPVVSRPGTTTIGPSTYRAPQPLGAYRAPTSVYRAPTYAQPYRYNNSAAQPYRYNSAAQPYRYNTPAQAYHANAPVQTYHAAPAYHYGGGGSLTVYRSTPAPAPHFAAPMQTYHAAPSYHYAAPSTFHPSGGYTGGANSSFHPSGGGGYHPSAGAAHFGGGGGRHR